MLRVFASTNSEKLRENSTVHVTTMKVFSSLNVIIVTYRKERDVMA